jgi:hypothetical protein
VVGAGRRHRLWVGAGRRHRLWVGAHGDTPANSIPAQTISAVAAGSVINSGMDFTVTPGTSA